MKSLNELRELAIRCAEEDREINKISNLKIGLIKEIDGKRDVFLFYLSEFRRKTMYEELATGLTIVSLFITVLSMRFFNVVNGIEIVLVAYLLLLSTAVIGFMFNVNKYRIFGIILDEIDKTWDTIEWPGIK
jgi:hypothetical protein